MRIAFGTATALTLLALAGPAARGQIVSNGSFESPDIPANSFQYVSAAGAWTFTGGGLIDAPSIFSAPTPPDGSQLAFLQVGNPASFFQTITLPASGTYSLSFFDAGRIRPAGENFGGDVSYEVLLNGTQIYSDATVSGQAFTFESTTFTAAVGSYTLTFREMAGTPAGDNTAYFDRIQIQPVPEPASTLLVCAVGAGGFAWCRRRRTRRCT